MLKISNARKLNYFDNFNMLNDLDEKKINKVLVLINNTTCKLQSISNSAYYYIIHKYTKENNTNKIQCSYFKNDIAISDFVRNDYKSILENLDISNLKIMEVLV